MGSDRSIAPETFEDRLARFLLVAFARGVDVEGTWKLAGDDPVISELRGSITRTGEGPTLAEPQADDPVFADQFETFLLEEFAEGVDVEGTWAVRFSRPEIPAWDVDITFSHGQSGADAARR